MSAPARERLLAVGAVGLSMAVCLAILASWRPLLGWGVVTVGNEGSEPVVSGVVAVSDQIYRLGPLAPGEHRRVYFKFRDDGGPGVVLQLASGRMACGGIGYAVRWFDADHRFLVSGPGLEIDGRPARGARADCGGDSEMGRFARWRGTGTAFR